VLRVPLGEELHAGPVATTAVEVTSQVARDREFAVCRLSAYRRVAVLASEPDGPGEDADPPLEVTAALLDVDVLARGLVEAHVEPAASAELRRDLAVTERRPTDQW
jgi:hypothetical protein